MRKILYIIGVLCLVLGCADHDGIERNNSVRTPITIGGAYPSSPVVQTRAIVDGGFVAGDEMGIFIVDRNDGEPGELSLSGNRASNIRFTLQDNGAWQASTQLYWDEKGASADFYGYYPFDGYLSSVTAQPFTVSATQDSEAKGSALAGYTASDLLWVKKENVAPTAETITLQYQHLMAGVTVRLERGAGFSAEDWASLDKKVLLTNTVTKGTVNLTTGTVSSVSGNTATIRPLSLNESYRAVVIPQTVDAGKELISILIDGQSYSLKKTEAMTFTSGKMHQFTVTVDRKTASGDFIVTLADEAITPWTDDLELHDGLVRQYVVVETSEAGTLKETITAKGIDYTEVTALKIVGPFNEEDSKTVNEMKKLTRLNLLKVIPENGTLRGIGNIPLEKVIFPEKGLKVLGGFNDTKLTGSLVIPEGVEEADGFVGCNFTGSLTLPSTLKKCGVYYEQFKGEFVFPDGLEEFGCWVGSNEAGYRLTGNMNLPQTLKKITGRMPTGLTGTVVIPQGCEITHDETFRLSQCTSVVFPEGMTVIPYNIFGESELRGEVRIPSTVTEIKASAFQNCKISSVILPKNLKTIGGGAFSGCSRLSGTIIIPKKVARIPENCFFNCRMLTGVVFHKDVAVIDSKAFAQCNNLNSIVCEGEEPPALVDDAFLGVPKDNFTVEVPKGCVEKYRNARGWGDFKRISEYSNFVCRPAQVNALNNAHQEDIVLNADGAWTASAPSWVTLSKTSGTGKTALTLTFQPLTKGAGNRTGTITFTMGNYTTTCTVSQYDYTYDEDACLTLQTATKGRGVDIVFAGDGWDGQSISDGSYLDLVKYQTECFFAIEPYKSMRQYFNVYVTFPLSQEKGVNTMYTYVNNRFGTLQGMSSLLVGGQVDMTSSQLLMETDELQQYVVDKTPVKEENLWRTLVIAVPNSTDYEGNTVFNNSGLAISICPPSEQPYPRDTRGTIQHEAGGHGFGKLGDEAITRNAFATISVKKDIEEKHQMGWFANLATTGKLNSVPWAEFIFDPAYSDYVDVFEGGYGYTRGIYRPEANSCMNYGIPYYNTPSRLDIYRRILDYAGESFSMSAFRSQDTFEWGTTDITRSAQALSGRQYVSGNHHVPAVVNFHEMGVEVRKIREQLKNRK